MTAAKIFRIFLNELKEAINAGNKSLILFCYDMINSLDFEQIPDDLLIEYNKLVSRGNDIYIKIKRRIKDERRKKRTH